MDNSIGKIIKAYRQEHGLSMQEFADMAGLSKGYISMLEKGIHPQNGKEIIPSIETVSKIACVMNLSIDNLLSITDKNQMISLSGDMAPVYESAAGEGRYSDGSATDEYAIKLEADQVLVKVKGRSMEPTIQDGDYVVVAAQSVVDFPRQIALVKINGDESTLKRIEVKEGGLLLIGDNTNEYPPHFYTDKEIAELPVTIEGVVVKLVREME